MPSILQNQSLWAACLAALVWFPASRLMAQESYSSSFEPRVYTTSGSELIFSFPDASLDGERLNGPVRFSWFFNFEELVHYDRNRHFGIYTGGAIRNVGFITNGEPFGSDRGTDDITVKRRAYTLGIPLGIKLGDFDKNFYVFGGGEVEYAFNYKEKRFEGSGIDKDRFDRYDEWFSSRTNPFLPSLMAGIQMPGGLTVRFKYYLTDLMNKSYTETVDGIEVKPYENLDSRMFYFSLSSRFDLSDIGGEDGKDGKPRKPMD